MNRKATLDRSIATLLGIFILVMFATCKAPFGLGGQVDMAAPKVSLETPIQNSYNRAEIIVSGTASDDLTVKSVDVTLSSLGGVAYITVPAVYADGKYTVSVPTTLAGSIVPDGKTLISAKATDNLGKTSSVSIGVIIDNTLPTVLVSVPQGRSAQKPTASTFLSIKGETYDPSTVSAVIVSLIDKDSKILATKTAEGTASWSVNFDFNDSATFAVKPTDGTYTYTITTTDNVGNISTSFYHVQDIWSLLSADSAFPTMDQIGSADQGGTDSSPRVLEKASLQAVKIASGDFALDENSDNPVINFGNSPIIGVAVPISGDIKDDKDGINMDSITASITGVSTVGDDISTADMAANIIKSLKTSTDGNGIVTFSIDLKRTNGEYLKKGRYSITLKAQDKAAASKSTGKTTATFNFFIDGEDPRIASWTPNSEFVNLGPGNTLDMTAIATDDNTLASLSFQALNLDGTALSPKLDATLTGTTWSTTLTLTSAPTDFKVRIATVDEAGKTVSQDIFYGVDKIAPTLTITGPALNEWLSGTGTTASGAITANDTNPVPYVKYMLLERTAAVPTQDVGSWESATGGTGWTAAISLSGKTEGLYTLYAYAIDKAGNKSPLVSRNFGIDQASPELTETGIGDLTAIVNKNDLLTGFSMAGTITETYGVDSFTITQRKDSGAVVQIPVTANAIWNLPNLPRKPSDPSTQIILGADGLYEYTITVVDKAGKEATMKRTVRRDTTGPDLSVSNLDDYAFIVDNNYIVNGSASDLSGLAANSIQYSLNDGPAWAASSAAWKTVTTQGQSWTLELSTLPAMTEGSPQEICFRASDVNGLTKVLGPIHFGVDLSDPELTVTNLATLNNSTQKADFTLAGTSRDKNGIKALEISFDGGTTWANVNSFNPATDKTTDYTTINWNHPITVNGLNDGTKAMRVRTTDTYNKKNETSFSIRFDATAPTFNVNNLVDNQLVTLLSLSVNGTWSDNGGSGTTGGLAKMQYSLDDAVWLDLIPTTASTWSGTIDFTPQGQKLNQNVYFHSIDNIGNVSASTVVSTLKVDTALPMTTVLHDGDSDWTGTIYISDPAGFDLTGTASDTLSLATGTLTVTGPANSGVGTLTFTPGTTSRAWSVPIAPTADGTYTYTITLTDSAGRIATETRTVVYDKTIPDLTISNLSTSESNYISTSDFTIRGIATDITSGVLLNSIQYRLDSGSGWGSWGAISGFAQSWNHNVAGLSEGSGQSIQFKVSDNAGNTTTTPVILIGVDLYNPRATETAYTSALIQSKDSVTFTGKADDDFTGLTGRLAATAILSWSKDGAPSTNVVLVDADGPDDNILTVGDNIPGAGNGDWSWTLNKSNGDGLYVVTLTVTDIASKVSTVTRTVQIDTTAPALTITAPMDSESTSTPSYTIKGTARDTGGVGFDGVSDISYKLDATAFIGMTFSSGINWEATVNLGATEGPHTLQFYSTDKLGNVTTTETRTMFYDLQPPTLDETTIATTDTRFTNSAVISLGGTLYDSNEATTVTISATKNGTPITVTPPTAAYVIVDQQNGTWTSSYTHTGDGLYVFAITGKDVANKTQIIQRTVRVDTTVPTVTPTALSGWKSSTVSIGGSAADTGGSTLDLVEYQVGGSVGTIAATAMVTGKKYRIVTPGDTIFTDFGSASSDAGTEFYASGAGTGTGTVSAWLYANGTASWSASVDTTKYAETTTGVPHIINVRSKDKAGNYSVTGTINLAIDGSNPAASMAVSGTSLIDGGAELRAADFTLSGACNDSTITAGRMATAVTLSYTKDGGSSTGLTLTTGGAGSASWTYNQAATGANDGLYVYTLTVEDQAGNVSTATKTVRIDKTLPEITITSPGAGEQFLINTATLQGTAVDIGSGIDIATLKYSLNGAAEQSLTLNGTSWTVTNAPLGAAQGAKTLYVTGKDKLGNSFTTSTVTFYYDLLPPTLAETTINSTDTKFSNNVDISLGGTLYDSNEATSVAISATKNGTAITVSPPTVGYVVVNQQNGTWTSTYTHTGDGLYVFNITGTDAANKTHIVQRTVRIDTTIPTVTPTALSGWKSGTVTIGGSAADVGGATLDVIEYQVGGSVGTIPATAMVTGKKYRIVSPGNTVFTDFGATSSTVDTEFYASGAGTGTGTVSAWLYANGTISWNANIDTTKYAETAVGVPHVINVRSKDKAGNYSSIGTINLAVDRDNPQAVISVPAEWLTIDSLYAAKLGFTLTGNANDFTSTAGRQADTAVLKYTKDGGALTTAAGFSFDAVAGTWSWDASALTDGLYVFTLTVTDIAANTTTATRTVRMDKTAPTVTIVTPTSNALSTSATYPIQGSILDFGIGVDSLDVTSVQYTLNGGSAINATLTGSNWSANADLGLGTGSQGTRIFVVTVKDKLGNSASSSPITFYYDALPPTVTETLINSTQMAYKSSNFTLTGVIEDTNAIKSIKVETQKSSAGSPTTVYQNLALSGLTYTWSALVDVDIDGAGTDPGLDDGEYAFTITATDTANRTMIINRTIRIDTSLPTVLINSLLPVTAGNKVNGVVTLSAIASDDNGIQGVKYFLLNDASTPVYATAGGTSLGNAPYSINIDTTAKLDGTWVLWLVAQDKAGNEKTVSSSISIDQTKDTPTATIDSPAVGSVIGTDKKVRGTFSDDDGVLANSAILYVRKSGETDYITNAINTASNADQLIAWTVDLTTYLALPANGDGTYEMYFAVTDDAARKSGKLAATKTLGIQTFKWDNNPPTISTPAITSPKAAYKEGDAIVLTWTAFDASGLASQTIDVDTASTGLSAVSSTGGIGYTATYTVPAGGSSGNRTFTLLVEDGTTKTSTRTITFLVDIDDPEVQDAHTVNPSFIGSTPNGQFELKGTATDNRALSKVLVQVSNNGGTIWGAWVATVFTVDAWGEASLSSGNWTFNVENSATCVPASGNLSFRMKAQDQAGNESAVVTRTQAVNQEADKPTVTIISPVDGSSYGTTVQISGTAADDDNLSDLDNNGSLDYKSKASGGTDADNTVKVVYRGVTPVVAEIVDYPTVTGSGKNANFNLSIDGLASGSWAVKVMAKDDAGTWGVYTDEVVFNVNAGAPSLSITTSVTTFIKTSTLLLEGTASDTDGVKYVWIRVNGGTWKLADGTWDDDNNGGTPVVALTDGNADKLWDILPIRAVNWSYTIDAGTLGADGLKTIEVQAKDAGDFIANQQLSTTKDTLFPEGTFDAQFRDNPSGSFLSITQLNKMVRVTGTVTELNLADTDPIMIKIDTGIWTAVTNTFVWSYVWDTIALTGDHTLLLKTIDKAGNETISDPYNVTINQAKDVPELSSNLIAAALPADAGNNVIGSLRKLSGTITDDDGFLLNSAVSIYLDGNVTAVSSVTNTAGTTASWEKTFAEIDLPQGEHRARIVITDRNGQTYDAGTTYFIVDTSNPTLTIGSPDAGTKIKAGTLTLLGTASDSGGLTDGSTALIVTIRHSNASSYFYNGGLGRVFTPVISNSDPAWSQAITIDDTTKDGTLYADLELTDRAGKVTALTRSFVIDTTVPTLTLSYPAVSSYINGLVAITGTADDTNGLSDLTFEVLNPSTFLPYPGLARVSSGMSAWEFSLNSTSCAIASKGVDVNGDSKLWKVFFKLTATDTPGNVTVLKPSIIPATDVSIATGEITLSASYVGELVLNEPVTLFAAAAPIGFTSGTTYYVRTKPSLTTITLSTTAGSDPIVPTTVGATVTVQSVWPAYFVDTDGDKPTISVTQPRNGDQIGGIVAMYGSGRDDDGSVMQVEMRIDYNGNGNFLDNRNINNDGNGIELGSNQVIFGHTVKYGNATSDGSVVTINGSVGMWEDETSWYVVPTSNNVFNLTLNAANELYASNTLGNGNIMIQVRTRDKFGLASEITNITISLDETFPRIENILPQDQTYRAGSFNLTAQFGDNTQLNLGANSRIKINVNKTGYQTLSVGAFVPGTHEYALVANVPNNGYDLTFPIDTTTYFSGTSGILYVDLFVQDESMPSPYTNQKSLTYYVDNEKPTIDWSTRIGAPDGWISPLKNGMVTINSANLAYVEGDYGDPGSVSGVDHIEMYFVKGGKVQKIKTGAAEQDAVLSEASVKLWTFNGTDWVESTGSQPLAKHSDAGFGSDWVIKIDNPAEMNADFQGLDTDTDGYYEFMGIIGSKRFRTAFNSQYLPDGLMDVHYVIYDQMGNKLHKVRRVFIANNKPEITQIKVGTDLNANTTIDAGELSFVQNINVNDTVINTGVSARNNRVFIEITASGGNGAKRYSIKHAGVERNATLVGGEISIDTSALLDSDNPDDKSFIIKVYDSTSIPTASETNQLFDTITVNLAIHNADLVPPVIEVANFGKYFVANANYASKIEDDVGLHTDNIKSGNLGYVELWANSQNDGTPTDADVSGEVIFKGKVKDDQRIQKIGVTIPGYNGNAEFDLFYGSDPDAGGPLVAGVQTGTDWAFAIDGVNNLTSNYGQVFSWNFTFNTAKITGGANTGVTAVFKVYDYRVTPAPNTSTSNLTFDVVPYVTSIIPLAPFTSRLSANTMNPLKSGYYGFYQGMTGIVINGFNLPSSTSQDADNYVRVGSTTLPLSNAIAARNTLTVNIPPTLTTSGAGNDLLNIKVNTVLAINNDNSGATYNSANEGLFTDDRKFYIDEQAPTFELALFGRKYKDQSTDDATGGLKVDVSVDSAFGNGYTDNVPYTGTDKAIKANWLGHVEYYEDSMYNNATGVGRDPDVSGIVTIRGKVADNQRIGRITATIPGFIGGNGLNNEFSIYINALVIASATTTTITLPAGVDASNVRVGQKLIFSDGLTKNVLSVTGTGTVPDPYILTWAGALATVPAGIVTLDLNSVPEFVITSSTTTSLVTATDVSSVQVGQILDFGSLGSRPVLSISGSGPYTITWTSALASAPTVGKFNNMTDDNWGLTREGADYKIDTNGVTKGHVLNWNFTFDTSKIALVAIHDLVLTFKVYDANNTPLSPSAKTMQMDVVPYITSISRDISTYNTNRSRLGAFILRQNETVDFAGFNMFRSTSDTISIGTGAALALPSDATSTGFRVTLPSSDTYASGNVLLTVSAVTNVNNNNDNTKTWNKEYEAVKAGSELWNDDRSVHIWRSDDNQTGGNRGYFTGSLDPEYPAMSQDGTGLLYGSWSNYASSSVYYGINNTNATEFFNSYDPLEHTDISFGTRMAIAWNANTYGNGTWGPTGAGGVYAYDSAANAALDSNWGNAYESELLYHDQRLMQFINQRIVTQGNNLHVSYYDTDTKAMKYWYALSGANPAYAQTWINLDGGMDEHDGNTSTSITYASATATNSNYTSPNNGVTVAQHYVVLGDKVANGTQIARMSNNAIVNATTNGFVTYLLPVGSASPRNVATTIGTLGSHRVLSVSTNVGDDVVINPTPTTILTLENYAGTTTPILTTVAGAIGSRSAVGTAVVDTTVLSLIVTDLTRIVRTGRSTAAGEFSAIAVTPNGYPAIAYYDITNQTVKLARASIAVPIAATDWRTQTVMTTGVGGDPNFKYSGKYISMRIDASGYVHLSFFRNSTGDLIYMRSTNTSNEVNAATPYTFGKSVIIDSNGSVGTWTDVSLDGTNPVISYLDSSLVNTFDGIKIAYYDAAIDNLVTATGDLDNVPDTIDGWETMNAALGYEVESVRTSAEVDRGTNFWKAAVGYSSSDYFRIGYYLK